MITLGATPKAFKGHTGIIQENAIRSWLTNHFDDGQKLEIILFGKEEGTEEMCKKYGLIHCPDIGVNAFGTPLLDSIIDKLQKLATNEIVCYISADTMLFFDKFNFKTKGVFFISGVRYDIEIDKLIDFEKTVNIDVFNPKKHGLTACEYWMFPKGLKYFPPFAVGRGGMDNWFVWYIKKLKVPFISCSPKNILAIHQNHDYSHIRGNKKDWKGIEAEENLKISGWFHFKDLRDADYILEDGKLRKPPITLYRIFIDNPLGRLLIGIKRWAMWHLK